MKKLSILGVTGSIGQSTLQVVDQYPELFSVVAIAAGKNLEALVPIIKRHRPEIVSVSEATDRQKLLEMFPKLHCVFGPEGLNAVAAHESADFVVAGVVGFAGMQSTLAAIEAGKDVGLANKEAMITAGPLMVQALKNSRSKLLPIDSEHNAIFQCLEGSDRRDLKRILLTCSGGPFRQLPRADFGAVTVDQALKHPNWVMGKKITIDSATLMNKGLEMIEARFLFDLRPEQVGVVIHPESVIHSMVEWVDGAVTASLGETTMRGPIAHVLHHPRRLPNVLKPIDWGRLGQLRFEDPDEERFPSLSMARRCLEKEGNAPVILNAANEVAVEAFLAKRISFTKIFSTIDQTLQSLPWAALRDVEEVVDWDEKARRVAKQVLDRVK